MVICLSSTPPGSLLDTYSEKRQVIAQNLIDFDREWSTIMAKRPEELGDPHPHQYGHATSLKSGSRFCRNASRPSAASSVL